MSTPREPFEEERWYHVFNHARGNDNLFSSESDYKIFLQLIEKYILPVADIYAYALLPNHFHFLIRIINFPIPEKFKKKNSSDYISHQWGNVQNTYSKKKNYKSGKRGGLFCQSINRNPINSEEYLQMCIAYIHNNPVRHGFCTSPKSWKFSSYNTIISDKPSKIKQDEVLSWFENTKNFVYYHTSRADEIFREKFNLD